MRRPQLLLCAALLITYTSGETDRVLVDVAANSRRCLGEEFPEDALGRWKFSVAGVVKHGDLKRNGEAAQKVRATVKDPSKKLLWSAALNDDATNAPAFSFTATAPGLYRACVENRHTKPQRGGDGRRVEPRGAAARGRRERAGPRGAVRGREHGRALRDGALAGRVPE